MLKTQKQASVLQASGLEAVYRPGPENLQMPLTHYWIASSHNTYLTEDQAKGPASTCGYILFLKRYKGGCVEIDPGKIEQRKMPDGSMQNDVTVTHLGVPTGKIWLSDLLVEMRNWLASNRNTQNVVGPIILSFDNKKLKNAQQQAVIWRLLDKHINMSPSGSFCHQDQVSGCSWYLNPRDVTRGNVAALTPQSLKGKFVIKWAECESVDSAGKCDDAKAGKGLIPRNVALAAAAGQKPLPTPVALEKYVHMPKSKTCKVHEQACAAEEFWQVRSTHKAYKYGKIDMAVVRNTVDNFVRVFPNPLEAAKIKSGNYAQSGSWLNGAQLVALNTQKQDRYWHVNDAMFRSSPYRLKPQWMRTPSGQPLPSATLVIQFAESSEPANQKLKLFHPSGETNSGKSLKSDRRVTFQSVYPDACFVYAESEGDFVGAMEIAPSYKDLSGIVRLTLTQWDRPAKSGVKYMGPNCTYSVKQQKSVLLRFLWSA